MPPGLHAPTPTDEPLELPALLLGSFPLDPTRRHVAPGPLTDLLVGQAASAYLELLRDQDDPLALLPGPMPVGRLDGALREAITAAVRETPLLVTTDGSRVAPGEAVTVVGADPDLRVLLADALGPLVADHRALDRLGARRLTLAAVVEGLSDLDREASWWRDLYAALDTAGVRDLELLAVLPVPLADGRLVRGPRGALLPGADLDLADGPTGLSDLGLRLVHPEAVHPLLLRAGAADASARTLLEAPELASRGRAGLGRPGPAGPGRHRAAARRCCLAAPGRAAVAGPAAAARRGRRAGPGRRAGAGGVGARGAGRPRPGRPGLPPMPCADGALRRWPRSGCSTT